MFTSYDWLDNPAVLRVRISDRKVEQVSDLTNLTDYRQHRPVAGSCSGRFSRFYSEILGPRISTRSIGKSLDVRGPMTPCFLSGRAHSLSLCRYGEFPRVVSSSVTRFV